ncbi:MmcQ/YjbR family DNA-binding protein [Actinomadura barringtoniae]|uniref:MmcQ/YjbR family DNA-binding protein n=1 Tax=Actinomadura barringtoniae TaxID=1427535 RepID=A0A939PM09_9ACTN|nr:MmcQ/YjbR family DNA-binding protein [Actinomadura barringtoniae]MBO2455412.1 MmcQ/YjbR family DNA-binding protein [Actinomadura barringtoniae]
MADKKEAPNLDLLDRISEDYKDEPEVMMGTMFRSPGLRVGGKIFAFLGFEGQLIVKLPRERAVELVGAGTAEEVVMGTRRMREWISFPCGDDRDATLVLWRDVAQEAFTYVDSLRRAN